MKNTLFWGIAFFSLLHGLSAGVPGIPGATNTPPSMVPGAIPGGVGTIPAVPGGVPGMAPTNAVPGGVPGIAPTNSVPGMTPGGTIPGLSLIHI